jgi:hypothetical protein
MGEVILGGDRALPQRDKGRWGEGTNCRENGRVPMAQAPVERANRIPGMDRRQPPAAFEVCSSS